MSRRCDICQRKPLNMYSRSHSNIATKRKQYLNLQKTIVDGKQVKACSKCIKTLSKTA